MSTDPPQHTIISGYLNT